MNKRLWILTTLIVLLILCGSTMETHAKVVGYWSFNNSEHIGEDSSPNRNHGELTDRNRAKWIWPGRVGGALQLDGGPGLEVPHDESLNLEDQLTLMCWVKFADLNDFAFAQRSRQQSLIWKSAPGGQVSYGLYANRGQLELDLPLYVNKPGILFSWLYVIDPKCRGQFINGIPDFPARCQRKFVFGLGDSQFGNLGFRASMPGPIAAHAVHPTFFVNFFPSDNPRLDEEEQNFLKEREQDFVDILSHFLIGTSNIYLPRIMRHYEHLDRIWFHFAVVADGHSIRLYVNGREKVSERQGSDRQPEPFINSQEPLTIGAGLDGSIDEVMILDHALTEDEIKEAMELGETGRSLGFLSSVDVEITDPLSVAIPVAIPDPNLARSLRRALGLASNAPIIRQAMQQLRELLAFQSRIKDLTGLEHATNLERLVLSGNQISDVSALAGLTNLQELHLANNQISDVSPLAGLTNLERLVLSDNQISDVSPLAGLTNLEQLELSGNQILDFLPLAGLTDLEQLFLGGPQPLDFSPLAGLTNLKLLLIGHTNSVDSVVFSPDGQTLASGSGDKTIRLWNPKTGRLLRTLTGHTSGIWSVSFSPDGQTLASGGRDTVRLWDVNTGEHLRTLTGHTGYVYSVSFSPDGQTLASGGRDDTVRLWNVNTGERLRTLRSAAGVGSVSFSPDGQTLASDGDAIRLWNANTGEHLRTLIKHTDWFYGVSFSPDGSTLASGGWDGAIRLWDANTGRLLRTLTGHTETVYSVSFSPDGQTLASGSGGAVLLWDITSVNEPTPTVADESDNTREGAIPLSLEDSRTEEIDPGDDVDYFSIQVEVLGQLTLWTTGTLDTIGTLGNSAGITLAANDDENVDADEYNFRIVHDVGPGTYYLKVESYDSSTGNYTVYAAFTPAPAVLMGHTSSVYSVVFSPDSQTLASGSSDATVRLWDAKTGHLLRTLTGHTPWVLSVSFSSDGQMLASGGGDMVRLWDVKTGRHFRTIRDDQFGVTHVAFRPGDQTLATYGSDSTVRLWDAKTGRLLRVLRHTSGIFSMSFSPDGQMLASGRWDDTIRLWDVNTDRLLRTLTGHTGPVASVSFSSDGQTLASSGGDMVRLWDVNTGRLLRTLTDRAGSVSFSSDGQTLASSGGDTVRLWDVNTGRLLRTLTGHTDLVKSVSFSPDGQTLASGSFDGSVRLWELAPTSIASERIAADVNGDGMVNIIDLTIVASNFGKRGENAANVNSDGVVNIQDLTLVAGAFGNAAGAPALWSRNREVTPTRDQIEQWLHQARAVNLTDATFQRGILMLEQLVASLTPKETTLLANYPNPFNPETWIPYQLAAPTDVSISIYAADGKLVRALDLGHRSVGIYESRSRAVYWGGRNTLGEPVASGVYFYTLTAGDFTATRKMLIRK